MNLKQTVAALLLISSLFSCKKESTDNTGGGGGGSTCTGTLELVNTSTNPYKVYINGVVYLNSMPGTSVQTVSEPAGTYLVRVVQVSGYVFTPTDETFNGSVVCDQKTTYTFP